MLTKTHAINSFETQPNNNNRQVSPLGKFCFVLCNWVVFFFFFFFFFLHPLQDGEQKPANVYFEILLPNGVVHLAVIVSQIEEGFQQFCVMSMKYLKYFISNRCNISVII